VIVDCGALPPPLVAAELFGHERGAFTGAVSSVPGAFERAHGGTLFLDEIGELPLDLQPALLRAIEAKEVRRIGGERTTAVDVRVVAATNRDLALEVNRGRFREDLYFRLAVVRLTMPPLRERIDDLPLLAVDLLRELGLDPIEHLTPEVLAALMTYDWPGNVRELRNTLERATALMAPVQLEPKAPSPPASAPKASFDLSLPLRQGKQRVVEEYERAYLRALGRECGWNISEMARRAGMDRMSIHRMIQRLRLHG
jgi:DNA-binding NtrC family response regulator